MVGVEAVLGARESWQGLTMGETLVVKSVLWSSLRIDTRLPDGYSMCKPVGIVGEL